MASFWVHNGYVTVEGEKMSKSPGNFTTAEMHQRHRGEVMKSVRYPHTIVRHLIFLMLRSISLHGSR